MSHCLDIKANTSLWNSYFCRVVHIVAFTLFALPLRYSRIYRCFCAAFTLTNFVICNDEAAMAWPSTLEQNETFRARRAQMLPTERSCFCCLYSCLQ